MQARLKSIRDREPRRAGVIANEAVRVPGRRQGAAVCDARLHVISSAAPQLPSIDQVVYAACLHQSGAKLMWSAPTIRLPAERSSRRRLAELRLRRSAPMNIAGEMFARRRRKAAHVPYRGASTYQRLIGGHPVPQR